MEWQKKEVNELSTRQKVRLDRYLDDLADYMMKKEVEGTAEEVDLDSLQAMIDKQQDDELHDLKRLHLREIDNLQGEKDDTFQNFEKFRKEKFNERKGRHKKRESLQDHENQPGASRRFVFAKNKALEKGEQVLELSSKRRRHNHCSEQSENEFPHKKSRGHKKSGGEDKERRERTSGEAGRHSVHEMENLEKEKNDINNKNPAVDNIAGEIMRDAIYAISLKKQKTKKRLETKIKSENYVDEEGEKETKETAMVTSRVDQKSQHEKTNDRPHFTGDVNSTADSLSEVIMENALLSIENGEVEKEPVAHYKSYYRDNYYHAPQSPLNKRPLEEDIMEGKKNEEKVKKVEKVVGGEVGDEFEMGKRCEDLAQNILQSAMVSIEKERPLSREIKERHSSGTDKGIEEHRMKEVEEEKLYKKRTREEEEIMEKEKKERLREMERDEERMMRNEEESPRKMVEKIVDDNNDKNYKQYYYRSYVSDVTTEEAEKEKEYDDEKKVGGVKEKEKDGEKEKEGKKDSGGPEREVESCESGEDTKTKTENLELLKSSEKKCDFENLEKTSPQKPRRMTSDSDNHTQPSSDTNTPAEGERMKEQRGLVDDKTSKPIPSTSKGIITESSSESRMRKELEEIMTFDDAGGKKKIKQLTYDTDSEDGIIDSQYLKRPERLGGFGGGCV